MSEIFSLVEDRPSNLCNFLEGSTLIGGKDVRVIYRHYATLYFVFVVDEAESELGILDLIQVFVESLDKCFENVCELDLVSFAPDLWFKVARRQLTSYHRYFTLTKYMLFYKRLSAVD